MGKEFKTIDEQIEILRSRNLIINKEIAQDLFKNNNYYYLINGYKEKILMMKRNTKIMQN